MPYADPERQAEYQREWLARRRAEWFADKACAECGGREDLQLDHVDPAAKVSHNIWSWSAARREAELAKCRPLCRPCHDRKSATEKALGERQGLAKLTEDDVRFIKSASLRGVDLALRFGVTRQTICDIQHGRHWRHVA